MSDERRTMKNWAARLSVPDELLTIEQARTLASIAAADRALETRDVLQDVQMRLARLELFIAATVPGYDGATQALVKRMLTEGGNQHADL